MRTPADKVVIGYCYAAEVKPAFNESLMDLLVYDMAFHRRIVNGGGRLATHASANLAGPRNGIVRRFLAESSAEWLWMLDTDMVFAPDTLERLLEFADVDKAPIVGALCFSIDEGRLFPTLYGLAGDESNPQVIRYHEWPPDAMMQVAATGTGCLLMHRRALQVVRDFEPPGIPGQRGFNPAFPWFQETNHFAEPVGEDITFCWRAGLAGLPVYVNTGVQVGHVKDHLLTMDLYLAQRGYLSPTHTGV